MALGGVLVDGGRFDWAASGKFPTLTEPYDGYHGIVFAEEFGPTALGMRARAEGLRDFGACMSPHNAFHLLQGVETLPLRMDRHVDNTDRVLEMLHDQRRGELGEASPGRRLTPTTSSRNGSTRRAPARSSASASQGGREAGRKFIEAVQLASHLANVGDAKTLVIHPGSTTHGQMTPDELEAAGIGEDLIRLSVGLGGSRRHHRRPAPARSKASQR